MSIKIWITSRNKERTIRETVKGAIALSDLNVSEVKTPEEADIVIAEKTKDLKIFEENKKYLILNDKKIQEKKIPSNVFSGNSQTSLINFFKEIRNMNGRET